MLEESETDQNHVKMSVTWGYTQMNGKSRENSKTMLESRPD